MMARDFCMELAASGRYHFTTQEAVAGMGSSLIATRAALRRLRQKKLIATPYRGFHLVMPPEYRKLGCLPPEQFVPQLMKHLRCSYYGGLLGAARYHGAAHHQPQIFQVIVGKSRPPIACGRIRVVFVARRNVGAIPTVRFNTPRGTIAVSTPEATAFDLAGYANHCGGLDNVATVLAELAEVLDARELARLAPLSPMPWGQRLGYLLERVEASERAEPLARYVQGSAKETVLLALGRKKVDGQRDERWKLTVNADVEPEL